MSTSRSHGSLPSHHGLVRRTPPRASSGSATRAASTARAGRWVVVARRRVPRSPVRPSTWRRRSPGSVLGRRRRARSRRTALAAALHGASRRDGASSSRSRALTVAAGAARRSRRPRDRRPDGSRHHVRRRDPGHDDRAHDLRPVRGSPDRGRSTWRSTARSAASSRRSTDSTATLRRLGHRGRARARAAPRRLLAERDPACGAHRERARAPC